MRFKTAPSFIIAIFLVYLWILQALTQQTLTHYLLMPAIVSFLASILFAFLFYKKGLQHLYEHQLLSYPYMRCHAKRRDTFPPDFQLDDVPCPDWLSEEGHFFSDIRLTTPITTCYDCGCEVDWREQNQEEGEEHLRKLIHLSKCGTLVGPGSRWATIKIFIL